jgi:hypothetical protein
VYFGSTIVGTYCFDVHSSSPTVDVEGFVSGVGKCLQVSTVFRHHKTIVITLNGRTATNVTAAVIYRI